MRHVRRCRDDEAATILAIINSRHACIATPFRLRLPLRAIYYFAQVQLTSLGLRRAINSTWSAR